MLTERASALVSGRDLALGSALVSGRDLALGSCQKALARLLSVAFVSAPAWGVSCMMVGQESDWLEHPTTMRTSAHIDTPHHHARRHTHSLGNLFIVMVP